MAQFFTHIPTLRNKVQMRHRDPSQEYFLHYAASLSTPKEQTLETFLNGVKDFCRMANLNRAERRNLLGDEMRGLHYATDLAALAAERYPGTPDADLTGLSPEDWRFALSNTALPLLIYNGHTPSSALNRLLHGPSVIDCGMFTQLAIWFGIRYMVGDLVFDQLFGTTPFYITNNFYAPITDPLEPFNGNPLYPFFSKTTLGTVSVTYRPNHPGYIYKHPHGNAMAHHCIVIDNQYTIFDPHASQRMDLTKEQVSDLMIDYFNKPLTIQDRNRLKLFRENPNKIHPNLQLSYQNLIDLAEAFADSKLEKNTYIPTEYSIFFDFTQFKIWLSKMMEQPNCDYIPSKISAIREQTLYEEIPFENKQMTFDKFDVETEEQAGLRAVGLAFCKRITEGESCFALLEGEAGIGKTAISVACAVELLHKGKHVLWLSEVTNKRLMSGEELDTLLNYPEKLRDLINRRQPDAIIFDDCANSSYIGSVLLGELFQWYCCNPGKGLLVTANQPLNYSRCYGKRSPGGPYHYPPCLPYTSPSFMNIISKRNLSGANLRVKALNDKEVLSDEQKITRLINSQPSNSVGIIVTHEGFQQANASIGTMELIPSYDEHLLIAIRMSLRKTNTLGPAFEQLTEVQKKWLKQFRIIKPLFLESNEYNQGIAMKLFNGSEHEVIAIELVDDIHWNGKAIIKADCLKQLLLLLDYCHDKGTKKIIIINHTPFSHDELLHMIKDNIEAGDKVRCGARLDNLLRSFDYIVNDERRGVLQF